MAARSPSSRVREVKLFRNNRSQAVRIPAEFELLVDRVTIRREGDALVIEPVSRPASLAELVASWRNDDRPGPDDQLPDIEDMPTRPETFV